MDFEVLLPRVALALGIGLLIGLERGWRTRAAESGSRTAGVRTFAISGLLGGISGATAQAPSLAPGSIILSVGIAAYALVITVFCREENRAEGTFSATTAIAGILTFTLGAYAVVGDERIAAAAAVAAAALLAIREELHGLVAKITWPELRSGLLLLAMTSIALPIMPSNPIGPFGGVNPREVWIIAIVLAFVSFIGGCQRPVAAAVSFLRLSAIAAALQPSLLLTAGPALIGGAAAAIGFGLMEAFWLNKNVPRVNAVKFRNPFGDVDLVTIAMARLPSGILSLEGAAYAILAAVASDTVSKVAIGLIGRGRFAAQIGIMAPLSVCCRSHPGADPCSTGRARTAVFWRTVNRSPLRTR